MPRLPSSSETTESISPPACHSGPDEDFSRREFLGHSAKNAAMAGAAAAGVVALAPAGVSASPNERVTIGVVGVRRRGLTLATLLAARSDTDVLALCDVDPGPMAKAASRVSEAQGFAPDSLDNYHRLLDRTDLDAVVIATPDHHHAAMAITACQAGKDLYLEAPVTRTLGEAIRLQDVLAESGRIVQCGLQQRSAEHFREAVDLVRSGEIGRVRLARAWSVHKGKTIPSRPDAGSPAGVDYKGWLGTNDPSGPASFDAARFHDTWKWFWDHGTGALGRFGVHSLDVARWGLDLQLPSRVSASGGVYHFQDGRETPDTLCVQFDYPDATLAWEHRLWNTRGPEGRSEGTAFYGELGSLIIDRGGFKIYGRNGAPVGNGRRADADHLGNFVDCLKTRQRPRADLNDGTTSSLLCHLGNLAYRVGHELSWDHETRRVRETLPTAWADGVPHDAPGPSETPHVDAV
tara:strand:- start:706 stop:2094 length:1389 start_codon:yes stop_codon:yes gene_type:complete